MTTKVKYSIVAVIVALLVVLGGIGLSLSSGSSTTNDLKSKTWTFTSSKGDGLSQTAKFSEKSLTLSEVGLNVTYQYKVDKKDGKEEITFTNQNQTTGKKEIRTFDIKKSSDEYNLAPTNDLAKKDTGDVTLIPK